MANPNTRKPSVKKLNQKQIDEGFRLLRLDSEEKRKSLSPSIDEIHSKPNLVAPATEKPLISRETKTLIDLE